MIHYYYGGGKGKTTAAMGLAVRALGRGKRVFIVQFLKNAPSGEAMFLEQAPGATLRRGKAGGRFAFGMTGEERAETMRMHNENLSEGIAAVRAGQCDMLVLDEVGDALGRELLDAKALLTFLEEAGPVEVVMTGHKPVPALLQAADYVTVMQKEKHPYDQGVGARAGVEF